MSAERTPGQVRAIGVPNYQQFGDISVPGTAGDRSGERRGRGQQGSAVNFVNGLIRRPEFRVQNVEKYANMWIDLAALTVQGREPYRIHTTPEIHQTIIHVSDAINFVLFDELGKTQEGKNVQSSILAELDDLRQTVGINQIILTYEEGLLLRDAAAVVNVAYDPGTPEDVEKRTFKFDDLEQKAKQQGVTLPYWYRLLKGE